MLVGGGPVHSRNRDVTETEVYAQLRPVMNDVTDSEVSKERTSRTAHYLFSTGLQRPVLDPRLVRRAGESRFHRRDP